MKAITLLVPCLLLALTSGGCRAKETLDVDRDEAPEPVAVAPTSDVTPPAAQERPAPQERAATDDPDLAVLTITAVDVDTALAGMCDIPDSKVYFKFDSAKMRPEAKELLDQIATCAKTGDAKGKGLRVIGRTDPRGSKEYNKELGTERADAVAKYLREQGVAEARVETMSRGERAADPAAPWSWPLDRRVTIRLGAAEEPAIR